MRRPWRPRVQSSASSQSSKSVRRVTETSSEASSDSRTGLKRLSCSAEVSAYDAMPSSRSWSSKVPMQPRSERWPSRETVFQVTKSGDSVRVGSAASGSELTEEVAGVEAASDIVLEDDDDEPLVADVRRSRAGRALAGLELVVEDAGSRAAR